MVTEGVENWLKYIPMTFAFSAAILSGLQTYFNFNKQVEGHKKCGNRYLAIMKKCMRTEALIKDRFLTKEQILKTLDDIGSDYDEVNLLAESFPTSESDYKKIEDGLKNGEEEYIEEELNA